MISKTYLSTTASGFLLTEERRANHGGSATDPAFNVDGIERAIQLAGAAFHAGWSVDKESKFALHFERTVRANIHTDAASCAERGVILERVGLIRIEHGSLQLAKNDNGNI